MPAPAADELRSALASCVLGDRTSFTRLLATGPDFLGLLQRLSTGDVGALAASEGRPTVLTTAKGRIVERLFVHHLGEHGVLVVAGPAAAGRVLEHLRRYTFAEKTGLRDISAESRQWVVLGPRAAEVLDAAGLARPAAYAALTQRLAQHDVHVLGEDGLSAQGFSVVTAAADAAAVEAALTTALERAGGLRAAAETLEAFRILRGIPAPGRELTDERNPLEAGLWEAVSFDKGCYVGQEVVARLRTYDKVSRTLVRVELPAGAELPAAGTALTAGGRAIGTLTSVILPPGHDAAVGLGYVKRRELPDDGMVHVGSGPAAPAARIVAA